MNYSSMMISTALQLAMNFIRYSYDINRLHILASIFQVNLPLSVLLAIALNASVEYSIFCLECSLVNIRLEARRLNSWRFITKMCFCLLNSNYIFVLLDLLFFPSSIHLQSFNGRKEQGRHSNSAENKAISLAHKRYRQQLSTASTLLTTTTHRVLLLLLLLLYCGALHVQSDIQFKQR